MCEDVERWLAGMVLPQFMTENSPAQLLNQQEHPLSPAQTVPPRDPLQGKRKRKLEDEGTSSFCQTATSNIIRLNDPQDVLSVAPRESPRWENAASESGMSSLFRYNLPTTNDNSSRDTSRTDIRELREIYKDLDKPIYFQQTPNDSTPDSVKKLLLTLPLFANLGIGVIPGSLENSIEFEESTQTPPPYAWDNSRIPELAEEIRDKELLRLAVATMLNSSACSNDNVAETGWQKVAQDFTGEALSLTGFSQKLQVRNTSNADLDEGLLPKKVQMQKPALGLAFSTRDETTWKAYELFRKSQPPLKTSQYTDPEFCRMIFPICIAVGGMETSYAKASLQGAVWGAAGLQKRDELRRVVLGDCSANNDAPPLVVFTCIGNDWKFHMAYRDVHSQAAVLLGGWNCGGYESIYQMFLLLKTLKAVVTWAVEVYWPTLNYILGALDPINSPESQ